MCLELGCTPGQGLGVTRNCRIVVRVALRGDVRRRSSRGGLRCPRRFRVAAPVVPFATNVRGNHSSLSIVTVGIVNVRPGVLLPQSSPCSEQTFTLTQGSPTYFELTADSGQTTKRAFCPDCGSRLFGQPGSRPDIVTIRAGSLDDPSAFRPNQDIFTASAQPWDYMNPNLPKAPKLPET